MLYDPTSPFNNGSKWKNRPAKEWIQEELSCFGTMTKQLEPETENLKDHAGIRKDTEVLNIRKSSDKSNETEDAEIITTMMITGIL